MIEFGKTLREAREAKGYTVSQLAEMTHILPQIIENLEREDFTKIVAPIYGRGFVKLYCEHVGIDAKALVEEFMEIYNGNRPPVIRLKDAESASSEHVARGPVESVEPPLSTPAEQPFVEPPPAEQFFAEPPPAEPMIEKAEESFFDPPADATPSRRDYRLPGYSMTDVPRSFWRFGLLAIAAIAVVILLIFGCRALYWATMTAPSAECEERAGEHERPPAQPSQVSQPSQPARASRKPIDIPPLYID